MSRVRREHFVVTLSGSAEALAHPVEAGSIRLRLISLQAGAANANPVYVGGNGPSTLSATNYGVRIPTPVDSLPAAPYLEGEFDDGAMELGDIYVIGTAGEKLHVTIVRYV